jgi:hypothetical protein
MTAIATKRTVGCVGRVTEKGRSLPLERRRRPAALWPIAALRASMAAVRYAAAARSNHFNAGDRPTAVIRRVLPICKQRVLCSQLTA